MNRKMRHGSDETVLTWVSFMIRRRRRSTLLCELLCY